MWPKGTRTSIDAVESHSPLVRVVREENWVMLMDELRDLRGERAAVVAWLQELSASSLNHNPVEELLYAARSIERGDHRREEE